MKISPTLTMSRRAFAATLSAAALGSTLFSGPVMSQTPGAAEWPSKPIRLVVGFSAGGGADATARLIAPRLAALLGQQVFVENRAGAAGLIAADLVAKAAPDGYSLLLADSSMLIAQHLQKKLAFDPINGFEPIGGLFVVGLMIVTSNDFPAKTPQEFIAKLQASPGKYSFASSGIGQVQHLAFEMIKSRTKSFVVHVPYRGAAQIVPDVMSGQIPIGVVSAASAMPQVQAQRLKAIATLSNEPLSISKGVPPLSQLLPGFDVAPRSYLAAPAGTPPAIAQKLASALQTVMSAPDMAAAATALGAVPAYMAPDALRKDILRESEMWRTVVQERKIVVE